MPNRRRYSSEIAVLHVVILNHKLKIMTSLIDASILQYRDIINCDSIYSKHLSSYVCSFKLKCTKTALSRTPMGEPPDLIIGRIRGTPSQFEFPSVDAFGASTGGSVSTRAQGPKGY